MIDAPDTSAVSKQRALLEYLAENTLSQEQALDTGDLATLSRLSEQRTRTVGAAALFVPPVAPWDPELIDLAVYVRDRSDELQQAIRQCMTSVRKELVALTGRQRLSHYLDSAGARPEARWQG